MFSSYIIYYTDSQLDESIAEPVRNILAYSAGDIPIISVSQKPLPFGHNICVGPLKRRIKSVFYQIKMGLKEVIARGGTYIFLCEHDVYYHPSHFNAVPCGDYWLFNDHNWLYWPKYKCGVMRHGQGRALSQGCVRADMLDEALHQKKWKKWKQTKDFPMSDSKKFPPRKHWFSTFPNIDLRHSQNFSQGASKIKMRRLALKTDQSQLQGWNINHGVFTVADEDLYSVRYAPISYKFDRQGIA